jgi:diadenosine tetraphosphate (Ap4A) HIT family hydrolase
MSKGAARAPTAIDALVVAARGGDPRLITKLASGWAMFGERQFVKGYTLLLPDPLVPDLNSLTAKARAQFLHDMALIGDALLEVTAAVRINYAIFGNLEPALHAHIVPRYADEPSGMRTQHPWAYDWNAAPLFDPVGSADLAAVLRGELARRGTSRRA